MKLETPRLVLREYMSRDWYAVLDYQSDGRYLRFCPWAKRTPAAARAFVDQFTGWARQSPRYRYQLAVTLGQGGTLIGSCGIRKAAADDQEAELGYEIAPDHWGHGYATEAAVAMVGWAFGALGLHRIIAHCLAANRASARMLEKVGMTLEAGNT